MKRLLRQSFFALFLLFCLSGFAQSKILPGFYISHDDDTVKGLFPNYTQWIRNPAQVQFEAAQTTKTIFLTPQTCRKFVIEGFDEYLSYTGPRLLNPIDDNEVIKNQAFNSTADTLETLSVFLRLVTRTPLGSLYAFIDNKRTNFFYQLPNEPLVELRYKKLYESNEIVDFPDYRQQLNTAFHQAIQDKHVFTKLEKLNYTEGDLTAFLQALSPAKRAAQKSKNPAAGWFASAGASLNMIKIKTDDDFDYLARKYNKGVAPLLSLGYYLPVDRNFGRYFLFPQVRFYRYKNTGEFLRGSFVRATTFQADLISTLEVSGGVNVVNRDNIRLFLSAGFGTMLQVNGKQAQAAYWPADHSLYISSEAELSSLAYAVNGTAGVTFSNKYMVSATYMFPVQIANFVYYTPMLSGLQLHLGYKLN